MKHFLHLLGASLLCASLSACSLIFGSDDENAVDYMAVQLSNGGNWSLIGPDGKLLYEDEFKEQPSAVVNGLFFVSEGEGFTLYEATERTPTAVPDAENLADVGTFNDDLIPVCHKNQRITVIDKSGNVRFTLNPVGGKEVTRCESFSDGMMMFRTEDGKHGFYNTEGEVVIKPKYEGATSFKDGYALAGTGENEEESIIYIINKKGDQVAKLKSGLEPLSNIEYDMVAVREKVDGGDNRCGFVTLDGEYKRLPSKAVSISEYNKKLVVFRNNEYKCGVMTMDDNHEVLIRAKYNGLQMIDDGKMFLAELDNKYIILDDKGEKLETLDVKGAYYFGKTWGLITKEGNTWSMVDLQDKPKNNIDFVDFSMYSSKDVRSDYFDVDKCAGELAALIGDSNVAGYALGASPSSYLSDPERYIYDYSFEMDESKLPKGYGYSTTGRVYCSSSIAYRDYDYWNFSSTVRWNPDSRIENFRISCNTGNHAKSVADAMQKLMQNKGYSIENAGDSGFTARNSKYYVGVETNSYNLSIRIGKNYSAE